ncbi:alpha-amylase family protein [Mycolicibacterium vaccae]|uniref:Alpha amylase n=1 Tax=Mycolicibacterium vaccae ATCC 25954 TaxID=1194972 RepID=K0V5F7_MYCVA|nr:alpha-amylase family protein [Mycolicibacterium vaccae]ANI40167.1 alpha-amylase [Mycolicibacterium vaccae 95051]EJZ06299.1 alpha amylase [Mycolicibacterium vaccae ATCC 25954]MCV7063311.1 alpha-amylase family protein [Mycolicibacterium vaccae]
MTNRQPAVSGPGWVEHVIWWQIYPLGFVGAYPADPAPGPDEHRLRRVADWLDYVIELGASGLALGPVFASSTHGYDTVDHYCIDPRLGSDEDFDHLVAEAGRRGVRILLDGVFNHVGADFPRYREALAGGDHQWFLPRGGGFATFEGHDGLITLNHANPEVVDYTVEVMTHWLDRGAHGWRLDAAYAVPDRFWAQVLPRVRERHPQAWFVGEVIHGDYQGRVHDARFDSVTQYELWKAIWSSLNDANFHELDWALTRHDEFLDTFVPLTFIGNHDVTRIASRLTDPAHVEHALVLLLTTGGTPSVYAGDEVGYRGLKEERFGGDDAVRPEFGGPFDGVGEHGRQLFRTHQHLIGLRRRHPWLHTARTTALQVSNTGYVYAARHGDHTLVVALNIDDTPLQVSLPKFGIGRAEVVAGSGAPPAETVTETAVPPNGWLILAPR